MSDPDPDALALGVPGSLSPGPDAPKPIRVRDALAFAVDDSRVNRFVAGIWAAIPVLGWFALHGWLSETQHRLHLRHPSPIPALRFRDFFHYVRRGAAPGLLTYAGISGLGTVFAAVLAIANATTLAAWVAAGAFPWIAVAVSLVFVFATATLGSVLLGSMITRSELTERLGPGLAMGDAWRDTRMIRKSTLGAYLAFLPIAGAILTLGLMICGIGVLPAWVVVQLAALHLRWQLYEEARRRGRELPEPKPPLLLPSEARLALPPKGASTRNSPR